MLIRLSLAECDVRELAIRFCHLVEAHRDINVEDCEQMQQSNYVVHSVMLASLLDLRSAYLRV